jgi:acyl-CoA reductase-like NAD-dependent aldehyde dehydrogenase
MEAVNKWLNKVFINGEFVDTVKGENFDTMRPTTGEVLCKVANGTREVSRQSVGRGAVQSAVIYQCLYV